MTRGRSGLIGDVKTVIDHALNKRLVPGPDADECRLCGARYHGLREPSDRIAWEVHSLNHTLVIIANLLDLLSDEMLRRK